MNKEHLNTSNCIIWEITSASGKCDTCKKRGQTVCVCVLIPTHSPDAGSRGWAAVVHPLVPFPKQLVHDFPFVICDSSLHLVHAGVPVLRL